MTRIAKRPGSGKPPHNGSARGAGWGGPAKGASTSRIKPGDPDGIQATRGGSMSRWNQERREAAADDARDLYDAVMRNEEEPTLNRMAAADKLLDRIEGKPVQKQDVTSAGERVGYVIAAPPEAADAEEWARQHPAP